MLMSPYADEVAHLAAEEKVAAVTTGAGNPGKYLKLWKDAGVKVMPVVASVAMAKLMEEAEPMRLSQKAVSQADISVTLQQWHFATGCRCSFNTCNRSRRNR